MNTVQRFVFPNLEVQAPESLYMHVVSRVWADLKVERLYFEAGGVMSTDTFYNGFTVGAWKTNCDLSSLAVRLEGRGKFVVTAGLHRMGSERRWLAEEVCDLMSGEAVILPLKAWPDLLDGMLFLRLRSVDGGSIEVVDYVTDDSSNAVRLGVVITHFNRPRQVLAAVERIRRTLLANPEIEGRLTLTVVDNSGNLPCLSETHPAITVIKNRNLGGTGGFVRGLLRLMDGEGTERHTHALFMDDDASCEAASIERALTHLSFSHRRRLAIAGALLRESAPWHLLEKGARFNGQVEPLNSGLDMRQVQDLLVAEAARSVPQYGAWWFFAFPIEELRAMPFPFFVRGDDVMFGLANEFDIATLNGVACLGDDFSAKHSPLTAYLDARYHLVLALAGNRKVASRIFWIAGRLFLKQLTSYQYSSARAVALALSHVRQGPDFFSANIDMQEIRREIQGWEPQEKLVPLSRHSLQVNGPRRQRESLGRRLIRAVTLQGFLLPGFLLIDKTTVLEKAFHGRASAVFRYRRVLYEHRPTGTGYMTEFDRRRFFSELCSFAAVLSKLLVNLRPLREQYVRGVERLSTKDFWRDVYKDV
jgi:galactofuranosylgalactofuranosylrhamnosyl-N-acetylglucosaminyl-diphospho-decaprenol beta-1,5/1,6-galactofuranosyltransferase